MTVARWLTELVINRIWSRLLCSFGNEPARTAQMPRGASAHTPRALGAAPLAQSPPIALASAPAAPTPQDQACHSCQICTVTGPVSREHPPRLMADTCAPSADQRQSLGAIRPRTPPCDRIADSASTATALDEPWTTHRMSYYAPPTIHLNLGHDSYMTADPAPLKPTTRGRFSHALWQSWLQPAPRTQDGRWAGLPVRDRLGTRGGSWRSGRT
jgi:hypothetical protein